MTTAEVYAERAVRGHTAMQARFRRSDGLYLRDGSPRLLRLAAHLWPFTRALVATLDLAGIALGGPDGPGRPGRGLHAESELAAELETLERYWDPDGPAYSSDMLGSRLGGDRYYDDNAWVGLALVGLERLRPGSGRLARARELFQFAAAGWDRRPDMRCPGGVFWVQQGRGAGRRNHDRNTVSNAPNAQLGMHLAELGGGLGPPPGGIGPERMYDWVNDSLDAGGDGCGPFWDKLRGDGTVDRALWSYNQGTMIGANVLLARRADGAGAGSARDLHLGRAETIARRALVRYDGAWERQPADFNAILYRNLLLLHAITADASLREAILSAMREQADRAWEEHRDRDDLFHPGGGDGRVTLRHQAGIVSLLALLAWEPDRYALLA
ncbi:MAG: glycoside hydrolase family 76 protein [Solirubrobacteraceae bacterium]